MTEGVIARRGGAEVVVATPGRLLDLIDHNALGLAGVAIKAGARSALATLWFINDEASATLVSEFYRQLRNPKLSKAQALQLAQQRLLADRVYEHPAYWSPFLLLNNWL